MGVSPGAAVQRSGSLCRGSLLRDAGGQQPRCARSRQPRLRQRYRRCGFVIIHVLSLESSFSRAALFNPAARQARAKKFSKDGEKRETIGPAWRYRGCKTGPFQVLFPLALCLRASRGMFSAFPPQRLPPSSFNTRSEVLRTHQVPRHPQ